MFSTTPLDRLEAGTRLLVGGNRLFTVPSELAERFQPGDALYVVDETAEVLHTPHRAQLAAKAAVDSAVDAFQQMRSVSDAQIQRFYQLAAERLQNDSVWQRIQTANAEDVADARRRGRSTTRLEATASLRANMIAGLRGWAAATPERNAVLESVRHETWHVDLIRAPLGTVGFVFEGRPNVVVDATGVLFGGNTVVFRIGRDALGSARALLQYAIVPALRESGVPEGAVSLVDDASHASGWALFSDSRLSLAVARGSGPAVDTLGSLARKAGVPTSLHGTGGAWLVTSDSATAEQLERVLARSLDRKVCNTVNTCCIVASRAAELVPAFLRGLQLAAARRGQPFKLHATESCRPYLSDSLFHQQVSIARAAGPTLEAQAEWLAESALGEEWEWEESPEVSLHVVSDVAQACTLFNRYSPHFVASLLSASAAEHEAFYHAVDAPFICDDMTRWVDGQFALRKPELGLSNWQRGRLFARGGILTGDAVYTLRTRASGKP